MEEAELQNIDGPTNSFLVLLIMIGRESVLLERFRNEI